MQIKRFTGIGHSRVIAAISAISDHAFSNPAIPGKAQSEGGASSSCPASYVGNLVA